MDTLVDESVPRLNRPQWPNVLGALGGGVFAIGALLLVTAPGLGLAALGYVSAALGAAMLAVAWIGQHEFAPAIGWIAVVAAFVITYGSLHAFAWSFAIVAVTHTVAVRFAAVRTVAFIAAIPAVAQVVVLEAHPLPETVLVMFVFELVCLVALGIAIAITLASSATTATSGR